MDKRWHTFLQGIVQSAHGESLPEVLQEKMVMDLSIQLEARVHELVLSLLNNESDLLEYQNLITTNATGEEVKMFMQSHIPDIQQRLEQCLSHFREDYLRICHTGK